MMPRRISMSHRRSVTLSFFALAAGAAAVLPAVLGAGRSRRPGAFDSPEKVGITRQNLGGGQKANLPWVTCDYSVLTAHNNNLRTGVQLCEAVLTPQTAPYVQKVAQRVQIGKVTGQPLVLHGNRVNGVVQDALIFAANPTAPTGTPSVPSIYFLNPATLGTIFQINLPGPGYCTANNWDGCYGVLSTPVIDQAANILYIVDARKALMPLGAGKGAARWRNNSNEAGAGLAARSEEGKGAASRSKSINPSNLLEYALLVYDINSMTQVASAVISGTCSSGESFSAALSSGQLLQRQRPALLLDHGHVYVAFGSGNNEVIAYNGWIFAYNAYNGQPVLTSAGSGRPYCASRTAVSNPWGRGGIWQLGAGISADSAGNVYAATGNGRIDNSSQDDSQSYVKIAGATWTGALQGKYLHPDSNNFLAPNELEGSSGPIVLPGPNQTQEILGATKIGLFTVMDASTMAAVQGPFRAAWHQYGPILGDPDPSLIEPDAISCMSPTGCNANGFPSFQGSQNCCLSGCTNTEACIDLIHGSHPHIHGQPCYLSNASGTGGTVFWWGEKDYPRYMTWNASQGTVVPVPGSSKPVDNALNRVSTDSSDLAPNNPSTLAGSGFMMGGMPGGLMSLSANGVSNAILWANVPRDGGCVSDPTGCSDRPDAQKAWLKAFDISGSLPKKHILQINAGNGDPKDGEYHAYPTIANGFVYLATKGQVVAFGVLPTTVGVFRPPNTQFNQTTSAQWLLRNRNTPGNPDRSFSYGAPGDIPVVGDWTGNGTTTIGVFRPPNTQFNQTTSAQWLLRNSNTPGNPDRSFFYGAAGDIPVVGDWTGSGTTTIGVFRPANTPFNQTTSGQWLLRNSNTPGNPNISFSYGAPGDVPVVGHWTVSGTTTIGVFRPANTPFNQTTSGQWLLRNSNTPGNPNISFSYGAPGDLPVVGPWSRL